MMLYSPESENFAKAPAGLSWSQPLSQFSLGRQVLVDFDTSRIFTTMTRRFGDAAYTLD